MQYDFRSYLMYWPLLLVLVKIGGISGSRACIIIVNCQEVHAMILIDELEYYAFIILHVHMLYLNSLLKV